MEKKLCAQCMQPFSPTADHQVYCSPECSKMARNLSQTKRARMNRLTIFADPELKKIDLRMFPKTRYLLRKRRKLQKGYKQEYNKEIFTRSSSGVNKKPLRKR
jgi:hypothetical protein